MNFFKKLPSFRRKKKIIGRVEKISIPSLDLYNIDAKIDSGAYRGTIHAEDIGIISNNGEETLEFKIIDHSHPENEKILHRTKIFKTAKVRSSQTDFDERYIVPIKMELAGKKIKTELSLSNREELRYPILIGRKSLKNRFLIDVSKK